MSNTSREKFCLKWNDFESNISSSFKDIKDEKDFMDVTLSCGESQVTAHKVVLSACSSFFRSVLRRNPHQHPLLYMKGVSFSDLKSLLDFMYYGEVHIAQENLNSFLSVAEELQVKGLTQSSTNSSNSNQTQTSTATTRSNTSSHVNPRVKPQADSEVVEVEEVQKVKPEPGRSGGEHQVVASYEEEYQDYQEEEGYGEEAEEYGQDLYSGQQAESASGGEDHTVLFQYIDKKTSSDDNSTYFECNICLKTGRREHLIISHLQTVHFPDSFSYNCQFCESTFRSKIILRSHVYRNHHS